MLHLTNPKVRRNWKCLIEVLWLMWVYFKHCGSRSVCSLRNSLLKAYKVCFTTKRLSKWRKVIQQPYLADTCNGRIDRYNRVNLVQTALSSGLIRGSHCYLAMLAGWISIHWILLVSKGRRMTFCLNMHVEFKGSELTWDNTSVSQALLRVTHSLRQAFS